MYEPLRTFLVRFLSKVQFYLKAFILTQNQLWITLIIATECRMNIVNKFTHT